MQLEFDLKKAVSEAKESKAKIILVQLPEGLKARTTEICAEIEAKTGATVITKMDPCFGACDLAQRDAESVGADLIMHFGHNEFFKPRVKTIFVPLGYGVEEKELREAGNKIANQCRKNDWKTIGMVCTVQFEAWLRALQAELEKKGITAIVKQASGTAKGYGQVLGCNYSAAKKVENDSSAIIVVCDGLFHPLGVAFNSPKPVVAFNPLNSEIRELSDEKEKHLRKRFGQIALARDAKSFGIIVSSKEGQNRLKAALELKKKIEEKGKTAFILEMDFVKPEYLVGVKVDALVNTACPRMQDDQQAFGKPLLSRTELLIALGEIPAEKFALDQM